VPYADFDPELKLARFLPRTTVLQGNLRVVRTLTRLTTHWSGRGLEVICLSEGASVRVHRPSVAAKSAPALLWIHGGGMVMGSAAQDDRLCRRLATKIGAVVASVEYRLAPEHPFPAALDDCYEALLWLAGRTDIDSDRIALGGASAGGGLAAAVALMAKERGQVHPVAQVLAYPMLDDRTAERDDIDGRRLRMWNQRSNRFGWRSYLGSAYGREVPPLAAPSRYEDLAGLPPAWIGVGTNDLFHDEDVNYARRLHAAGVPCQLHLVPGAYHGFDAVEPRASVSRAFEKARADVLDNALNGREPVLPA
jgi:acetyl esterase/lipase